jgi:hypothetical protein
MWEAFVARDRNADSNRAGVGPVPDRGARLVSIRDVRDFKIADSATDVRGWTVRTLSGRSLGTVEDLLVDPDAGQVVMLEIGLEGSDRHALAPVRAAQFNTADRTVLLDSADLDRGGEPPSYRRGEQVSEQDERDFDDRYRTAYGPGDGDEEVVRRRGGESDEVVVERRPVVVEETIVRRRVVDPDDEPRA